MKNVSVKIIPSLIFCFSSCLIFSQDVVNPYQINAGIFATPNPNPYSMSQSPWNFTYDLIFPDVTNIRSTTADYYKGEYEICIRKHFWWDLFNLGVTTQYSLSYKYEIVSYPFTVDCAFINGCAAPVTTTRELRMPNPSYTYSSINNNTESFWNYTGSNNNLFNIMTTDVFENGYSGGPLAGASTHMANSLVSGMFVQSATFSQSRRVWPHTVIKHTVNLHCGGTPTSSNILDAFSWYYDNTRGQMRWYPFASANIPNGTQAIFDEIFIPEIIFNQGVDTQGGLFEHSYDETITPTDIIMPLGTINYFKYMDFQSQFNNVCSSILLPSSTDLLRNANGTFFNFPFATPYTVLSSPLRHEYGYYFAGYSDITGVVSAMSGMKQNYFLDQNINLTIINPTDHTIYNPSEVTITANNLVFPSGYTFKTIRGVYPTEAAVLADDIAENGGIYADKREVPVKTDLTSERAADASIPTAVNYPYLFASRYYVNDAVNPVANATLTIEPCVRLFDCTFDVNEGGSLIFESYPGILGKEDHSSNHTNTRYKIRTLGGAVLRNYAPVQYLQNGKIVQTIPLHYKATDVINAGKAVTHAQPTPFDTDDPQGDYSVEAGANVTLQAGNTIRLTDGFSVKAGATFHAYTGSIAQQGGCPVWGSGGGTRLAGKNTKANQQVLTSITATPNPNSGHVSLMQNSLPIIASRLHITDAYGRTVYEKEDYNSATDAIDLSHQPSGLYMARCTVNGKAEMVKVVVSK